MGPYEGLLRLSGFEAMTQTRFVEGGSGWGKGTNGVLGDQVWR